MVLPHNPIFCEHEVYFVGIQVVQINYATIDDLATVRKAQQSILSSSTAKVPRNTYRICCINLIANISPFLQLIERQNVIPTNVLLAL